MVPKHFLMAYHLWIPYYHCVQFCSRKTLSVYEVYLSVWFDL